MGLYLLCPWLQQLKIYFSILNSVEVNISLLEDVNFLLEVVSEPGYVLFLLLDSQVWVPGQTGHHKLHEVTHGALTGETFLQVFLKEDMLMKGDAGFLFQA